MIHWIIFQINASTVSVERHVVITSLWLRWLSFLVLIAAKRSKVILMVFEFLKLSGIHLKTACWNLLLMVDLIMWPKLWNYFVISSEALVEKNHYDIVCRLIFIRCIELLFKKYITMQFIQTEISSLYVHLFTWKCTIVDPQKDLLCYAISCLYD